MTGCRSDGISFYRDFVLLGFRSDGFSFYWALAHYSAPVEEPSIVTSMSVCVFVVCLFVSISPELAQSSPNLFARVTYGRDSVLGLSIRNDVKHGWNSNGRRGRDGG